MTQKELYQALKTIGYHVAYSHFSVNEQNPPPTPPYIAYKYAYSNDLMADNENYADIGTFQIELYTDKKDLSAEQTVQDKLKELELPYAKSESWIDSEEMFQIVYEVQIIGE